MPTQFDYLGSRFISIALYRERPSSIAQQCVSHDTGDGHWRASVNLTNERIDLKPYG